jgi:hypothetical protein
MNLGMPHHCLLTFVPDSKVCRAMLRRQEKFPTAPGRLAKSDAHQSAPTDP